MYPVTGHMICVTLNYDFGHKFMTPFMHYFDPRNSTNMGPSALILLFICGVAFAGGGILISKAIAKTSKNSSKGEPYECGIPTSGTSWIQFNVGYYLYALIFLVFDVELVFMYPWAVAVKKIGMAGLVEIVIFMFILFMGLLYAFKKGALKWM
jgi:NADH:ubiquinone oxidoreductase subunit 3 (subunit A)